MGTGVAVDVGVRIGVGEAVAVAVAVGAGEGVAVSGAAVYSTSAREGGAHPTRSRNNNQQNRNCFKTMPPLYSIPAKGRHPPCCHHEDYRL